MQAAIPHNPNPKRILYNRVQSKRVQIIEVTTMISRLLLSLTILFSAKSFGRCMVFTGSNFTSCRLIPFGKGARYCPGKYFFKHYYFELICYILQRYTIAPAGDIPVTDPRDIPCALAPMGILHDTKAKLVKRS